MSEYQSKFLLIAATEYLYYILVEDTVYTHYKTLDILVVHGESRQDYQGLIQPVDTGLI